MRLKVRNSHERDGKKKKTKGFYLSVTALLDRDDDMRMTYSCKEAMQHGTDLHKEIETFYEINRSFDSLHARYLDKSKEFHQFLNFAKYADETMNLEPYRTEWSTYSNYYHLSGTIDMVFRSKKNHSNYFLIDWKRSQSVHQNSKCLDRYTAQINLYRIILENDYQMNIEKMFLVLFHPKQEGWSSIDVHR
jgi:ATP-dependent exoDNAse (exonuclease V) beta subunit